MSNNPSSEIPPLDDATLAEIQANGAGAVTVGRGVERIPLPKAEVINPTGDAGEKAEDEWELPDAPTEPGTVSLDPKKEWSDRPLFHNQIEREGFWKPGSKFCKVFDLSNENHLAEYNDIMTKSLDVNSGIHIVDEQKAFSDKSDNWKVMITVQKILFRVVVKKDRKK